LALDCATHQGKSYVDIRCRFFFGGLLHNFHLLAIPLFGRHTASNIFTVVEKFLTALVPKWREKLIGVATDGAATMVGSINGIATLMEKEAVFPVTRVWCGLHQLDLKMQLVFQQALNDTYLSTLTALIGYLRRQQNLITEMRSTCPKVANTRWLSMFQVADWLCRNGFAVRAHLVEKAAPIEPNIVWWIFLYALREVAREANAVFVSLQGGSTLVQQQNDRLCGLVARLCEISGANGPHSNAELRVISPDDHEINGSFSLSHSATNQYIQGLDLWVCEKLPLLRDSQRKTVAVAVARMYVLAASSIHGLTTVQKDSPPVTPKDLVSTTMTQLSEMINERRDQLTRFFGEAGINRIGLEFNDLRHYSATDTEFRSQISAFDHRLASFDDMWNIGEAGMRFPTLANFCGGFASVFPNTATVEADFSVLGCEKNDKRGSLTDLSLEGVLHCKQWRCLAKAVP